MNETVVTHLSTIWALICFGHQRAAVDARTGGDPSGELQASLVAMCAAAFSLEALYYHFTRPRADILQTPGTPPSVWIVIPAATLATWQKNRTQEGAQVFETLKLGFTFPGSVGGRNWGREFRWLFRRRHLAVHWEEKAKPAAENIDRTTYSADGATRAAELLAGVFNVCASNPKPEMSDWHFRYGNVTEWLATRP
jgi:hypothetical protein